MLDHLIKNGTIVDGTGAPRYVGTIGILNGKLCRAEADHAAKNTVDAAGKIVCPGFIDAHSHGDLVLGQDFALLAKTSQGVTSELTGQCGLSLAPIDRATLPMVQDLLKIGALEFPARMADWSSYHSYWDACEKTPKTTNIKVMVGHSTLRVAVMDFENRPCTGQELEKMKELLRQAMESGAAGLSTGLVYTPSCYATTHEIEELARVIAPYGGIYASHIRNESSQVLAALEEALRIGKVAGVPVMLSHHKVMGQRNWPLQKKALALIDRAVADGVCVTYDQYPYTWNQTALNVIVPPRYFTNGVEAMAQLLSDSEMRAAIRREIEDPNCTYDNFYQNAGGWSGVLITGAAKTPAAVGKTIAEYADELGADPWDVFFDILVCNKGDGSAVFHTMSEENLFDVIRNPHAVVGSDGLIRGMNEKGHPRAFATMPRAINCFVRENHLLTLEEMIRKMTGLPAQRLGFEGKGVLKPGYDADVLIIDYEHFYDRADYISPCALTEGLEYVFVNGTPVWQNGQLTDARPGKMIPHRYP